MQSLAQFRLMSLHMVLALVGLVCWRLMGTSTLMAQDTVNPGNKLGHISVGTWNILGSTANAPSGDADLSVGFGQFIVADERATTISCAGVNTFLATSAEVALVQPEVFAKAGLPQQVLALTVLDERHLDLLEDVLVCTHKRVLTPSSNNATRSRSKLCISSTRQADVIYVVLVVDSLLQFQDSNVVPDVVLAEFRMHIHSANINILVRKRFSEGVYLPVSQTNLEVVGMNTIDAMGHSEQVSIRDETSTTLEGIVGEEHNRLPREFSKISLKFIKGGLIEAGGDLLTGIVTLATLPFIVGGLAAYTSLWGTWEGARVPSLRRFIVGPGVLSVSLKDGAIAELLWNALRV